MKSITYVTLFVLGTSAVYAQSNLNADITQNCTQEEKKSSKGLEILKSYLRECAKDTTGKSKIREYGYPHASVIARKILKTLDNEVVRDQNPLDSTTADISAITIKGELIKYRTTWQQENVPKSDSNNSNNPLLRRQVGLNHIYHGTLESNLSILYTALNFLK